MPRTRKTIQGDPAQAVKSVPGVRYGEGQAQQGLQEEMPTPNTQQPIPAGPPPQPVVEGAPPNPDAVQAFLGANNPNLFAQTDEPDRPVTDGLSTGPGLGPSAIRNRPSTPIARFFENLANETGDPTFRHLAERAGL